MSHHQNPGLVRITGGRRFLVKLKLIVNENNEVNDFWMTCQITTVTVFDVIQKTSFRAVLLGCAVLGHLDLYAKKSSGREGHETFCFVLEINEYSHIV